MDLSYLPTLREILLRVFVHSSYQKHALRLIMISLGNDESLPRVQDERAIVLLS